MTRDQYTRRREICSAITLLLADDPEALGECMSAMMAGMREALDRAKDRAATSDAAMLAALALMDQKRVSEDVRDMLGKTIARGATGSSPVEIAMRARFGEGP